MTLNVAGVLIFLSVCGVVASNPDRAVDCRKFVFAPLCRGVAAKRGFLDIGRYGQDMYINEERHPLKNPLTTISLLGVLGDENVQIGELTNREEAQKLAKMYQQNRRNHLSRMMFENMMSNNERDNFHAQELEDLYFGSVIRTKKFQRNSYFAAIAFAFGRSFWKVFWKVDSGACKSTSI